MSCSPSAAPRWWRVTTVRRDDPLVALPRVIVASTADAWDPRTLRGAWERIFLLFSWPLAEQSLITDVEESVDARRGASVARRNTILEMPITRPDRWVAGCLTDDMRSIVSLHDVGRSAWEAIVSSTGAWEVFGGEAVGRAAQESVLLDGGAGPTDAPLTIARFSRAHVALVPPRGHARV